MPEVADRRLLTFDAMRGLAAIIVFLYHFDPALVPHGYLAVDFFFLLSGFVISKTYDARLATGMSIGRFFALRVIRLYPLFALGLLFGTLLDVAQILRHQPEVLSGSDLGLSAVVEAIMLPSPVTPELFPLNMPAWSLFFEVAVNLFYALFLARAGLRGWAAVARFGGAALIWIGQGHASLDLGYAWASFGGGAVRAAFGFTLGAILARCHRGTARSGAIALVPPIGLVVLLIIPLPAMNPVVSDLIVVMLIAPVLVWIAASFNPWSTLRATSRVLGDVSYPFYAIHGPLMWALGAVLRRSSLPTAVTVSVFAAVLAFACWLLDRHFDAPLRAMFKRRLDSERLALLGRGLRLERDRPYVEAVDDRVDVDKAGIR